jgi:uncharacterized protein YuzE
LLAQPQYLYDPSVRALYLRVLDAPVRRSRLLGGGDVAVDLDDAGRLVGVEVLELDADLRVLEDHLEPERVSDLTRALELVRPSY